MSNIHPRPNPNHPLWWHAVIKRLAATRLGSWLLSNILHRIDRLVLRLSKGRRTLTSLLTGVPVVWLTTTGAKSGQPRIVPLLSLFDEDKVILIASNWGDAHHPAWYFNLHANPQATLFFNGQTNVYAARDATQDERERYWPEAVALYPGWQTYKQRARDRQFPIMVLSLDRNRD